MKKLYSLLIFLILINTSSSCENDDICDPDTPTTPRLIITFYDSANPSLLKPVSRLFIQGEGMETGYLFNGVSTIQVPLNISENSAKYTFTLNYNDPNPERIFTDTLQFNYTRQTLYVSRACGYKTIYDLNPKSSSQNAVVLNNDPDAIIGSWIKLIKVINYNVVSENETQINIYYKY